MAFGGPTCCCLFNCFSSWIKRHREKSKRCASLPTRATRATQSDNVNLASLPYELCSTFRAIYIVQQIQQQPLVCVQRSLRKQKYKDCGAQHAGPSFAVQPAVPMAKQTRNSHGRVASATGGGSCSNSGRGHGLRFPTEPYSRRHEICTVARDQHLRPGRTSGGLC